MNLVYASEAYARRAINRVARWKRSKRGRAGGRPPAHIALIEAALAS